MPYRTTSHALEAMAEKATVDAYRESEQICGWACMFDDHVAVPFETIDILERPLPSPPPTGAE
jgi:hypothetical protein